MSLPALAQKWAGRVGKSSGRFEYPPRGREAHYRARQGDEQSIMTGNDYVARFAEYHRQHSRSCEILDGVLWMEYQHMVTPVGPDQTDLLD